jgi:hypothetical protein
MRLASVGQSVAGPTVVECSAVELAVAELAAVA